MRGDVDAIFEKTGGSLPDFVRGNIAHMVELALGLDLHAIEQFVEILKSAKDRGASIFVIGNGGSASAASHFALDLANRGGATEHNPYRIISLADSSAYISALGNDVGYENVFLHQLRNVYRPGDVLIVISASGNSPNLLRAIEYVNSHAGTTVGLVGFDGGECAKLCSSSMVVKSTKAEYGPVETIQLMILHIVIDYLFLESKKKVSPWQTPKS